MFAYANARGLVIPSKAWSGTLAELKAKAEKLDRAIDRMLQAHGLEDASKAQGELETHAARQIEKLEQQSARIKAFLKDAKPKLGPNGKESPGEIELNKNYQRLLRENPE